MKGKIFHGRAQAPLLQYNPLAPWRLIESPPSDVFFQMNLDEELFEEFLKDPEASPLLRIYRVSKSAVTVGRSWRSGKVGAALRGCPETRGRPHRGAPTETTQICIRPTGGGLVRHGKDLIYSVIARRDSFPTFHQVRTSYLSFHEAVQDAFQTLGLETRLFRCDEAMTKPVGAALRPPAPATKIGGSAKQCGGSWRAGGRPEENRGRPHRGAPTDCFANPIATDVLLNEQKIAGGAQRRKREAFLHQGSIEIPSGISFEILKELLVGAFQQKFGIVWMRDKMVERV